MGREKAALTVTGAGVVARNVTFSNNISELVDGAPTAPQWLFHYITVTSHAAGLSRTVIIIIMIICGFPNRVGVPDHHQQIAQVTQPNNEAASRTCNRSVVC